MAPRWRLPAAPTPASPVRLNALTNHKGLARTSKTPGRTQQMVAFCLPPLVQGEGQPPLHVRLIDLPGYGYAKVPLEMRDHWKQEIDAYLHQRRSLRGTGADRRHPPSAQGI